MATKDYILKPGEPVADNVRAALQHLFSSVEWEKMALCGARVRIITTSP
jgi:hypothetical protein